MSTLSPASRIQANLQELFQGSVASGNAYIRFRLSSEITALLPMTQVEKSLIVEADQITPLPGMPASVIGMINSRDRVFCVFDLAKILTLPSQLTTPRQYQIIVLQTNSEQPIQVGLAVMNLQGIIRLTDKQIKSSSEKVSPSLREFVSSVVEQEVTISILEFERILQALQAV